jgi:hypothetical protein
LSHVKNYVEAIHTTQHFQGMAKSKDTIITTTTTIIIIIIKIQRLKWDIKKYCKIFEFVI